MTTIFTRRTFVGALAAAGGTALAGCGRASREEAGGGDANGVSAAGPGQGASAPPAGRMAMTVYRDPSCGCCEAWAKLAEQAGFAVGLIDHQDMPALKRQHGVPEALASCHTTIVSGYAVEGHVPLADVARLLAERPASIRGIAVPGMPRGSPGMEMPDGSKDRFEVIAFDAAGKTTTFNAG